MAQFMIVLGGMMSAFGMFNALVMSYSRLRWPCTGRHAAKVFRQDEREDSDALGGHPFLRNLLALAWDSGSSGS